MTRRRTAISNVAPPDSVDTLIEIEAVIVVHATVRRAAVASLVAVSPRSPRTVEGTVIRRKKATA